MICSMTIPLAALPIVDEDLMTSHTLLRALLPAKRSDGSALKNSATEFVEFSQHCDDSTSFAGRAVVAVEHAADGEKCTVESLCHSMQLLDMARMDKSLPCKDSEGANCQRSYYSAYKCKDALMDTGR